MKCDAKKISIKDLFVLKIKYISIKPLVHCLDCKNLTINKKLSFSKVDLEFMAKSWFSIGTIYRAPPLLVETILSSEEATLTMSFKKLINANRITKNQQKQIMG